MLCSILFMLCCACTQEMEKQIEVECARTLSADETVVLMVGLDSKDRQRDSVLPDALLSRILQLNGEAADFEVFLHTFSPDSAVVELYGIEHREAVEKTVCGLLHDSGGLLPERTSFLFYRHITELPVRILIAAFTSD